MAQIDTKVKVKKGDVGIRVWRKDIGQWEDYGHTGTLFGRLKLRFAVMKYKLRNYLKR